MAPDDEAEDPSIFRRWDLEDETSVLTDEDRYLRNKGPFTVGPERLIYS